ncbi:MAG: hypothetical protein A2020_15015 [Lentisphaerae bacterium GWF2_45_14]|nr:MAG: hypothetical protein A2020_15015 [Lentisphaerae bacterium GWF2_45_14]
MTAWVTGIGCVSAAGEKCFDNFEVLKGGIPRNLSKSDTGHSVFAAPLNENFNSNGKYSRSLDLLDQALHEALKNAAFDGVPEDLKVGVCIGTTSASFLNNINFHRKLRNGELDTGMLSQYRHGNPSEFIKRKLKLSGPAVTVTNACSSGTDAIGVALSWIKSGLCDIVIAGGADELHPVSNAGFYALGVMSKTLCRPFDRDRDGLSLGEGAGILILENSNSMRRRAVEPLASVAAYGGSNDAHHIAQPDPAGRGIEKAMLGAIRNACISPGDIGFINAHGTGTIHSDSAESSAFKRIFGVCRYLSVKGCTGHTLGAAGAIEAILTIMILRKNLLPASPGFEACGQGVEIPPVTEAIEINAQYAMSTSLAFGGCNSAVIIKKESFSE